MKASKPHRKIPHVSVWWTPWRSFLRTCLLTFHDFIAYIKNKENKSTSNLQYSFVLSGPDTTHHQATINEQECVECQNRKSREETVLRTKEPGKKKTYPCLQVFRFHRGSVATPTCAENNLETLGISGLFSVSFGRIQSITNLCLEMFYLAT